MSVVPVVRPRVVAELDLRAPKFCILEADKEHYETFDFVP